MEMDSFQEHSKRKFYIILSGALFIHLLMMVSKMDYSKKSVLKNQELIQKIQVNPMSEKEWKEYIKEKKQIVQSEDRGEMKKPTKEAFLSDKDRKVERETLARHIDIFNKAAKGTNTINQNNVKQASAQNKKKSIALKDLGVGFESGDVFKKQTQDQGKQGLQNGEENSRGLASTNDYIEHATLGDFTQLNTVEFKHYGFFHRIRQKLEQFWGKSIQEKAEAIFKSGRRLPANENLITSLQITLNERGEIIKVIIKGSSGVKELDDAATDSFNQAGPFPNPPKDMLVNGKATIEWGFVVKS
jgi:protein TonB